MMRWVRAIVGVLFAFIGIVWFGQGTGLFPGSAMTGLIQWAIAGIIVFAIGAWLLRGALRTSAATGASRQN